MAPDRRGALTREELKRRGAHHDDDDDAPTALHGAGAEAEHGAARGRAAAGDARSAWDAIAETAWQTI